jgi:starch synthase
MSETDATPDLPASQPYPVIGETISASLVAAVVIAASEPRIEPTRRVLFVTPEIADFVKVGRARRCLGRPAAQPAP